MLIYRGYTIVVTTIRHISGQIVPKNVLIYRGYTIVVTTVRHILGQLVPKNVLIYRGGGILLLDDSDEIYVVTFPKTC